MGRKPNSVISEMIWKFIEAHPEGVRQSEIAVSLGLNVHGMGSILANMKDYPVYSEGRKLFPIVEGDEELYG